MTYTLITSKKFDKEFSKLEKLLQDRMVEKLEELIENPKLGKPLKGRLRVCGL
ncbi:MAG: hypothetical protein QMC85_04725 [Methanocellales archaeon]|nr:hypothetical protein [Methanocellales archaeon]